MSKDRSDYEWKRKEEKKKRRTKEEEEEEEEEKEKEEEEKDIAKKIRCVVSLQAVIPVDV